MAVVPGVVVPAAAAVVAVVGAVAVEAVSCLLPSSRACFLVDAVGVVPLVGGVAVAEAAAALPTAVAAVVVVSMLTKAEAISSPSTPNRGVPHVLA